MSSLFLPSVLEFGMRCRDLQMDEDCTRCGSKSSLRNSIRYGGRMIILRILLFLLVLCVSEPWFPILSVPRIYFTQSSFRPRRPCLPLLQHRLPERLPCGAPPDRAAASISVATFSSRARTQGACSRPAPPGGSFAEPIVGPKETAPYKATKRKTGTSRTNQSHR